MSVTHTQYSKKYDKIGYRSVRVATRDGRLPTNVSGDRNDLVDRVNLIGQHRDFMRDNSIYRGMVDRWVAYIVGPGFGLQARTKNENFNRAVEALWKDFWSRPTVEGNITGHHVELMACRELAAGDFATIKLRDGTIQMIEPEQVAGKTGIYDNGIDKARNGRVSHLWIAPYGKHGSVDTAKSRRYQVGKEALWVGTISRPSSSRGVPPLQSAFSMLHRINDILDSEALAWQTVAKFALKVLREGGAQAGFNESASDPDKTTGTDDDITLRVTELDSALIFHGNPGDAIEGIKREIPAMNFTDSVNTFMRMVGLPLGLPLEIILLDWTKSNYSQSKAVLEQAYQNFLMWQQILMDMWLTPIYEWKVREWVKTGLLPSAPTRFAHDWTVPTFPWLDQLKEAQAYALKCTLGFATHGEAIKSRQRDRGDLMDIREAEVRDAIARAKKIEEDTGQAVPWEMFAGVDSTKVKTESPRAPADFNDEGETDE